MENAVEKICDVTDDDEREILFDDQMFAILGVVQPIEKAMRRSKPVISGELLHLLLGGLLCGCRGLVKICASVVAACCIIWFLVFRFLNSGYCCVLKWRFTLFYLTLRDRNQISASCSGHQVSQSAEVVSSSGEGKQPPHFVDSSQLHFL